MTRDRFSYGQRGQLGNGWFTHRNTIPSKLQKKQLLRDKRVRREAGFICGSLPLWSRSGEQMEWVGKMIIQVRRVCGGVASRIRSRRSGLLKLRRDVRACEYEDVRVMWEMLKRNKTELDPSHGGRKRELCSFLGWARSAPCLGRRMP